MEAVVFDLASSGIIHPNARLFDTFDTKMERHSFIVSARFRRFYGNIGDCKELSTIPNIGRTKEARLWLSPS